ncbi:MAG TPA: enoyl-CoA hydratase [Burkholderiaceae bacterium]|nr:enoyl-CoA hydratase [Burkholderiaceae bacterium]
MKEPLVLVERDPQGYAVVTLNRPSAMNALSVALRTELAGAIDELAADPTIRVMILTGAGRAFTAGLDLKELGGAGGGRELLGGKVPDPVQALGRFAGPIIAAINGAAITGGFELALACDVLLASTAARFADTHARVGVMPGWGLSQILSRTIGRYRAKELSLTGNFLSAQQALDWGLVNRVVEPQELLPAARRLALDMLSAAPDMLVAYKKLIDDGLALPYGEARALELARAGAANRSVDADAIEARREAIRTRGREQS